MSVPAGERGLAMKSTLIAIMAALGGVAVAVAATGRHRGAPPALQAADHRDESNQRLVIRALKAQISLLQARLAARERACGNDDDDDDNDDRSPQSGQAAPEPANEPAPSEPREAAAARPAPDSAFAALEAAALNEPADPLWSLDTEQRLRGLAGALQPAAALERVRCAQQICRLEIRHAKDAPMAARLARWLEGASDFSSEQVIQQTPNGDATVVLLTRPGAAMAAAASGGGGEEPPLAQP